MDFLTPMQKSDKEFVGQYICSGAHGIVVTEKRTLTRSLKSSHICARVLIINWFFYTHMVSRWRRKLREASEQAAINSNVWRSQKKKNSTVWRGGIMVITFGSIVLSSILLNLILYKLATQQEYAVMRNLPSDLGEDRADQDLQRVWSSLYYICSQLGQRKHGGWPNGPNARSLEFHGNFYRPGLLDRPASERSHMSLNGFLRRNEKLRLRVVHSCLAMLVFVR